MITCISLRNKNQRKGIFFAVFLSVLIYLLPSRPALAEDISLTVSPTTSLINLKEPGDKQTLRFSLTNNSAHPQTVAFRIFPIEKVDKNTNRLIYQSISSLSNTQQSFYSNAISFSVGGQIASEITLSPKQTRDIDLTATYNMDQTDSEYAFTLGFIAQSEDSSKDLGEEEIEASLVVQGGIASHVLVSLGNSLSEVNLSKPKIKSAKESIPSLSFELENTTDKTTKLYGNVSVTNAVGMEIASYDTDDIYLQGYQKKTITVSKDQLETTSFFAALSLGSNIIKIDLYNTSSGQRLGSSASFTYIPLNLILMLVALLLVILLVRRKLKRK